MFTEAGGTHTRQGEKCPACTSTSLADSFSKLIPVHSCPSPFSLHTLTHRRSIYTLRRPQRGGTVALHFARRRSSFQSLVSPHAVTRESFGDPTNIHCLISTTTLAPPCPLSLWLPGSACGHKALQIDWKDRIRTKFESSGNFDTNKLSFLVYALLCMHIGEPVWCSS